MIIVFTEAYLLPSQGFLGESRDASKVAVTQAWAPGRLRSEPGPKTFIAMSCEET